LVVLGPSIFAFLRSWTFFFFQISEPKSRHTLVKPKDEISQYRSPTSSPHAVPARAHLPPPAIPERPRAAHLACTSTPYTFRPPAPPVRTGTADAERRSRRPWCRPRMVCGKVAGVPLGIGSRFRPPVIIARGSAPPTPPMARPGGEGRLLSDWQGRWQASCNRSRVGWIFLNQRGAALHIPCMFFLALSPSSSFKRSALSFESFDTGGISAQP